MASPRLHAFSLKTPDTPCMYAIYADQLTPQTTTPGRFSAVLRQSRRSGPNHPRRCRVRARTRVARTRVVGSRSPIVSGGVAGHHPESHPFVRHPVDCDCLRWSRFFSPNGTKSAAPPENLDRCSAKARDRSWPGKDQVKKCFPIGEGRLVGNALETSLNRPPKKHQSQAQDWHSQSFCLLLILFHVLP